MLATTQGAPPKSVLTWTKKEGNTKQKMGPFPGDTLTYAQILPRLFVGSHPRTIADIELLRQQLGVTAVLNIHTDQDMSAVLLDFQPLEAHYRTSSVELRRVPMLEQQPELRAKLYACVDALNDLLAAGHTVYLHCTAGIGRAPTVAIGYLHFHLGWDWDVAVAHVKRLRECNPHLEALRLALEDQALGGEATDETSVESSPRRKS
jgi:protein-tyrosine phosphatase